MDKLQPSRNKNARITPLSFRLKKQTKKRHGCHRPPKHRKKRRKKRRRKRKKEMPCPVVFPIHTSPSPSRRASRGSTPCSPTPRRPMTSVDHIPGQEGVAWTHLTERGVHPTAMDSQSNVQVRICKATICPLADDQLSVHFQLCGHFDSLARSTGLLAFCRK